MTNEIKQAVLDRIADVLESELPGVNYVLILTERDSTNEGTDFATCTNVDEASVSYICGCVGRDMALALALAEGTSQ